MRNKLTLDIICEADIVSLSDFRVTHCLACALRLKVTDGNDFFEI
jgi:hypothetical protein